MSLSFEQDLSDLKLLQRVDLCLKNHIHVKKKGHTSEFMIFTGISTPVFSLLLYSHANSINARSRMKIRKCKTKCPRPWYTTNTCKTQLGVWGHYEPPSQSMTSSEGGLVFHFRTALLT